MYAYLDIDISDSREAYKRATDFVKHNSIKYGLSSDNIKELGGRELLSLPDLYENDYSYNGNIIVKPQRVCRLVIELYNETSPLAATNFLHLCIGDKGMSKGVVHI